MASRWKGVGTSISISNIDIASPRSSFTWTFAGSTVTCLLRTARISSRSTGIRSDWLIALR